MDHEPNAPWLAAAKRSEGRPDVNGYTSTVIEEGVGCCRARQATKKPRACCRAWEACPPPVHLPVPPLLQSIAQGPCSPGSEAPGLSGRGAGGGLPSY